jgi:predicted Zn-dependent protease
MKRMKLRIHFSSLCRPAGTVTLVVVLAIGSSVRAQTASGRPQIPAGQSQASQSGDRDSTLNSQQEELRKGTALTRRGSFADAIPHLLAARGQVSNEYGVNFNLALCYVGTRQFKSAIEILNGLRSSGRDGGDVENLLAQAYVGNAQPQEALASLQKAAALSPQNEKLYAFVADACMDRKDYHLGITVLDIGLRNLPQSARLHYERAMFLTQLDEPDQAKQDFELARKLEPEGEIGFLAVAHEQLFAGDILEAIQTARAGIKKGYENHALLTVLGEALIRSGVSPGRPEFVEAQTVLEKTVAEQPNDATSQIALGSLYLAAGRLEDAIVHLEKARSLDHGMPSVYANLSKAYQRHGDVQQAQDALAMLQKLNLDQAERISSAPGDRKLGYAGHGVMEDEGTPHP